MVTERIGTVRSAPPAINSNGLCMRAAFACGDCARSCARDAASSGSTDKARKVCNSERSGKSPWSPDATSQPMFQPKSAGGEPATLTLNSVRSLQ